MKSQYRVLESVVIMAVGAVFLAGCPSPDGGTYVPGSSNAAPTATQTPMPTPVSSPLSFSLATDKARYKSGETVRFSMTLRNDSNENRDLQFGSGQNFDVVVTAPDSTTPVFQWSRGRFFTQSVRDETLAPGESRTFEATWDGKNADGKSVAGQFGSVALLKTSDKIRSKTVGFSIAPGEAKPTPAPVSPLVFGVVTDRESYKKGQPIRFDMTLLNPTAQTQNYEYPSGQSYEVDVLSRDGRLLWRWSQGQMFTLMIRGRRLPAGESERFFTLWNARKADGKPLQKGVYIVRARLNTRPPIKARDQTLVIK